MSNFPILKTYKVECSDECFIYDNIYNSKNLGRRSSKLISGKKSLSSRDKDCFISNAHRVKADPQLMIEIEAYSLQLVSLFDTYYRKTKRRSQLQPVIHAILLEIIGRFIFEKEEKFKRQIRENVQLTKKVKNDIENNGTNLYFTELATHIRTLFPDYSLNIDMIIRCLKQNLFFLKPYKTPLCIPRYHLQQRFVFLKFINLYNLASCIKFFLKRSKESVNWLVLLWDKVFYEDLKYFLEEEKKLLKFNEGFG